MKRIIFLYSFCWFFVPCFAQLAVRYDILINEIMEDATLNGGGTLGLPPVEYIELYNRSDKAIDLEGFSFFDSSNKPAVFPSFLLKPQAYLIIGKANADELGDYGDFLSLPDFPTLSSEEELILKDAFGVVVDAVNYTQDWYRSSSLASGGYALERISPQSPCEGFTNWTATTSLFGGTPGKENAVNSLFADHSPPSIINAYPIDPNHILLTFSEAIYQEDLWEIAHYSMDNNQIISIIPVGNIAEQIMVEIADPLRKDRINQLEIAASFRDCVGNVLNEKQTVAITLPALAEVEDVVINEILYDPETGGSDFLELFNNSQKVIDLSTLILINLWANNPVAEPITAQKLLFPNEYAVLTESPSDILNRYTVENPNALLRQDLPNFPNKEGNVSLFINESGETVFIDQLDYTDDFHSSLLNDKEGVSLERVHSDLPTQDAGNWHSAAATVGYATPTFLNSQNFVAGQKQGNIFTLSNKKISPDGDGFEDFLQINYTTEKEGISASIHIYDAAGRLVKKIAQNELLATLGSFKWDGTKDDGQKSRIGIYVLWVEAFSPDGTITRIKEPIIVAGKL